MSPILDWLKDMIYLQQQKERPPSRSALGNGNEKSIFSITVEAMLKPTVFDPQGEAVLGALHGLGFTDLKTMRIGKVMKMTTEGTNKEDAKTQAEEMCKKLLTNPVIEHYTIRIEE